MTGKYDFPTVGYYRFATLQDDLNRVLNQLETMVLEDRLEVLENDSDGLPTDSQQTEMEAIRSKLYSSNYRPEYPAASREAHAEAIVINARIATANEAVAKWHIPSAVTACEYSAHQINAAIDSMVSERQHIDVCQYDEYDETFRVVSLGYEFKSAGHDWYKWAKATALRLWESGYIIA